jgi:hypothetical protein
MELPTSWVAADLPYVRYTQSGDIVFIACQGQQQRKIERRGVNSWSVVLYKADDGPFQNQNTDDISLTPSVLTGNGTLTASRALFSSSHVGCLFRLFSSGQSTSDALAAQNTFGSTIRVTGTGGGRAFNYAITGTWSATVTLQRSIDSSTAALRTLRRSPGTPRRPIMTGWTTPLPGIGSGSKPATTPAVRQL